MKRLVTKWVVTMAVFVILLVILATGLGHPAPAILAASIAIAMVRSA